MAGPFGRYGSAGRSRPTTSPRCESFVPCETIYAWLCFKGLGKPRHPQDRTEHRCINLRLPTRGGLYAWGFEKGGREVNVRVEGRTTFNSPLIPRAVLGGLGLPYLPEDQIQPCLDDGGPKRMLADWCAPFPGYHLYYWSRRQPKPAFALLVEALRYRG